MKLQEEKQIRDYLCRPTRYANIDGITEMTAGLTWLGLSAWGGIPSVTPKGSVWHSMGLLLPLFLGWQALIVWGSKQFKNRVTFPRTGYVAYSPAPMKRTRVVAFFSGAIASVAMFFLLRWTHGHLPLNLLFGTGMTIGYAILARRERPWKWAIVAVMAAGAVWLGFLRSEEAR